ncbi:GNAT family N-acetyltransferase [Deinococcus yavapaiensis]|uniref:RimJ/RimL family protein N-acetyltransferase n=1 Tax=Deinococcus yavapaiensis KR-236 TaxID=694435 RepID=A0A318S225_9DEIO|nr:GNAT family N-acetyltransferase [Deinococcus yavapaiensis]PYE49419.1 RimJ/RimL family protein N-acetyltransferase [Deinococcus yavapaiensis KR-236]
MSRLTLQSYRPENAERFLTLFNQSYHSPISLDRFNLVESLRVPDAPFARLLAFDAQRLVGAATLQHGAGNLPGWFNVHVIVDRERRGEGVARTLLEALGPFLDSARPVGVEGRVLDADPTSRAWAERRGLHVASHSFASVLPLEAFSFERFAAQVTRVEREGVRFVPLHSWLEHHAAQDLHALVSAVMQDEPTAAHRAQEPFEHFERGVIRNPFTSRVASFVAMRADRPVGFTLVRSPRQDGTMMIWGTGVARDERGSGLSAALKALSARAARNEGGTCMQTDNDARNAAMLRVNERLGFVPTVGVWRMRTSS